MSDIDTAPAGLEHVVVAGGTPGEWAEMDESAWRRRLETLAAGAAAGGARWVTLLPRGGGASSGSVTERVLAMIDATGKVQTVGEGPRRASHRDDGIVVVVDPRPDGHGRFASELARLCASGVAGDAIDEAVLSTALLSPAPCEPDLVVVLGPPDVLPESLVWELAYSELVFLDIGWRDLEPGHLELAIDDFNRRHRRFGGLDS